MLYQKFILILQPNNNYKIKMLCLELKKFVAKKALHYRN